jgi:AcrR family transcriptional regulator
MPGRPAQSTSTESPASARRRRGTSEGRNRGPDVQLTPEYLANLPAPARRLVDGAVRVLLSSGYAAISYDAVERESGENKGLIRYYFGGKQGLIAAVIDSMFRNVTLGLLRLSEDLPWGEERIGAHITGARALMEDPEFVAAFEVIVRAFTDDELRQQLAGFYEWCIEVNTECFGVVIDESNRQELKALGSLFVAAIDGLAIQRALNPDGFDLDRPLRLLGSLVKSITQNQRHVDGTRTART